MDPYETLRNEAAKKRDARIHAARVEYQLTLRSICAIERRVGSQHIKRPGKDGALADIIAEMAPRDRAFTFMEILEQLEQSMPERQVRQPTARALFQQLRMRGVFRRLRMSRGKMLWAVAEYTEPETTYGTKRFAEVAAEILRETGPLMMSDLVMEMRERGYRSDEDPRSIMHGVGGALRKCPEQFQKDDEGKWSVI